MDCHAIEHPPVLLADRLRRWWSDPAPVALENFERTRALLPQRWEEMRQRTPELVESFDRRQVLAVAEWLLRLQADENFSPSVEAALATVIVMPAIVRLVEGVGGRAWVVPSGLVRRDFIKRRHDAHWPSVWLALPGLRRGKWWRFRYSLASEAVNVWVSYAALRWRSMEDFLRMWFRGFRLEYFSRNYYRLHPGASSHGVWEPSGYNVTSELAFHKQWVQEQLQTWSLRGLPEPHEVRHEWQKHLRWWRMKQMMEER